MKTNINRIGLNHNDSANLAQELNNLLANLQVFYMNARGFHWNIKGEKFFELHLKFEELYNDLLLKIDEVAERILTLGHTPEHSFSQYTKTSTIKESQKISDGLIAVEQILEGFKTVIVMQREILALASDANDEGTNALMSDYIRFQEKQVWMYSSFLTHRK